MSGRRGISPVIATVIIVAVTIAVAIAVAFWMTGIIGLFTGFEQLQITSIYDETDKIVLTVKNTGTQTASITEVYVNGRPCVQLGSCTVKYDLGSQKDAELKSGASIPLKPGESATLKITYIDPEKVGQIGPGVSVEVKLLTASGKEYPKLIVLQAFLASAPQQPPPPPSSPELDLELNDCCKTTSDEKVSYTLTITVKNKGGTSVEIYSIDCGSITCTLDPSALPKTLNPNNDGITLTIKVDVDNEINRITITVLGSNNNNLYTETINLQCNECQSSGT